MLKLSLLFQKLGLSLLSVIDLPLKYNICRSFLIIFLKYSQIPVWPEKSSYKVQFFFKILISQ